MRKIRAWGLLCPPIIAFFGASTSFAQWVPRNHRWQPRGPWTLALPRELPRLFHEFNGIDFGHAHLGETLLRTQDPVELEKARLEVLDFIFSAPLTAPDEEQVAPTLTRMIWEVQSTFDWAHAFHRSLYDLFASDVKDKDAAYRRLLADYLEKEEAVTSHPLDLHGKLWSFKESKAFRDKAPRFNSQIWAYHWLQASVYDVQLMGSAAKQRALMPRLIEHYHGYLTDPPVDWRMMPMFHEAAPEFTKRFPEAAGVFDNLHMLHDNVDDVLSRPDLYPTNAERREVILKILAIYLHRSHAPEERYRDFHGKGMEDMSGMSAEMGPRPPSAADVVSRNAGGKPQAKPAGSGESMPGMGH